MTRSEELPTICPFCETQNVYSWTYYPVTEGFAEHRYIKCKECDETHSYKT